MNNEILNKLLPIKTDRLIIRKISKDDVEFLLKTDKQENTQLYLGGIKDKSKEDRQLFIDNKIEKYNSNKSTPLTVCINDKPIGFIEFLNNDNNLELSYIFDSDYWNNGYCTEACKELINILFNEMNMNYLFARSIEGNNSSMRVLEKLGFNKGELLDRIYIHTIREYRNYYKYDLKRND